MPPFCIFDLVRTLIIMFATKFRFGRNRLKLSLIKKKFFKTCQIVKFSCLPNLIFFIHLMKKNISLDVPKFRFFLEILNFRFRRRNRIKTNKINLIQWTGLFFFGFEFIKIKEKYFRSILTSSTKMSRFLVCF